jgi:hypothetical protein
MTILVVATCGALAGAVLRFSHVTLSRGAFLVATVTEKDLHQETKIYRDRIRRAIGAHGETLAGLYHGDVRDAQQARELLRRSPALGGVIWGSERWMTASLQQYPPRPMSSFPVDSVAMEVLARAKVADLMIVTSVPSVSLSHGHEKASVHFLAELVQLWREVPNVMTPGVDTTEFERAAYTLARTQARWTSRSHLAVPMWLAGTVHLIRALSASALEAGELSCAITKLQDAIAQFRTHDNPGLEAAVRNNYAIALFVQSFYDQQGKQLRARAMKQLVGAARLRRTSGSVGASVWHNRYAAMAAKDAVKNITLLYKFTETTLFANFIEARSFGKSD